jgi:hypothetical protein
MARVRKPQPTLETLFFATPEQKVLRLLLAEPTTALTPRVISSKLKGVRGLGGADGIMKVLNDLQQLGFADFVDNHRAVRLQDDNPTIAILKTIAAIADLESLRKLAEPISSKGILFGSRSNGRARSDSDYDVFVVSDQPEQVTQIGRGHPLGKALELIVWTPDQYAEIERTDASLAQKLAAGVQLWGSTSTW